MILAASWMQEEKILPKQQSIILLIIMKCKLIFWRFLKIFEKSMNTVWNLYFLIYFICFLNRLQCDTVTN